MYIWEKKGVYMQNQYTAIIKQDGDFWIGWIKEIPGVNCQEFTIDELMFSLETNLIESIECEVENKDDMLEISINYIEEE